MNRVCLEKLLHRTAAPLHLRLWHPTITFRLLLNLSDNALAGEFPKVVKSLKNLSVVSLKSNYFLGSIPSGFQFVQVLDLSSNLFNGTLSLEFGGENLRYLNLSYKKLSGSVPLEFVKKILVNSTIDLSFNNLTGPIPQSIALLNQKTELFVGNANLCGKPLKKLCIIPSSLSTPPNVTDNVYQRVDGIYQRWERRLGGGGGGGGGLIHQQLWPLPLPL
ncbi:hypothetical protein LguiA_013655 [Lonicera macranthoides]